MLARARGGGVHTSECVVQTRVSPGSAARRTPCAARSTRAQHSAPARVPARDGSCHERSGRARGRRARARAHSRPSATVRRRRLDRGSARRATSGEVPRGRAVVRGRRRCALRCQNSSILARAPRHQRRVVAIPGHGSGVAPIALPWIWSRGGHTFCICGGGRVGLRRRFKAPISSEARVRIPSSAITCFFGFGPFWDPSFPFSRRGFSFLPPGLLAFPFLGATWSQAFVLLFIYLTGYDVLHERETERGVYKKLSRSRVNAPGPAGDVFGLWRVCFPPILIRTDRRLLV